MSRPFNGKKARRLIVFMLFFVIILSVFYKIDKDLKPILMAYCDNEARMVAMETINGTIREEFGNKISYDDLMTIKTDKDGNVVMIQANTVELNRIGSQIALSVQKRIEQTEKKEVRIPIGALFKNDLFAFYGPKIKFRMAPAGNVYSSYRSEFSAAGINQTRHIIYLDVKASVQVVIPLARNSVVVNSSIPIAESIIVGKVPDTYANIDGLNSSSGQSKENGSIQGSP